MKFSPALFTRLFLSLAAWLCAAEVASAQTPSNDNFVSRSLLTGNSPSTTGSNVNATAETGEPFTWTGRNSVWWAWTAPSSGTAVIRTFYSTFDTTLAVHRGTSVSALTTVASNDDDPITLQSHLEIPVTAGVQYQIQVSSHGGQSGAISLAIAYVNTGPPDSLRLSKNWMDETSVIGTEVAILSSTDPDTGDVANFSLVPGDGSADNSQFTIAGNRLKTAAAISYNAQGNLTIRIRATDRGGLATEQSLIVLVVPKAPNAVFTKKSESFIELPNYVNAIFQLSGKQTGKGINYPKEFFDPGSESYRPQLFRAFEAATTSLATAPISLQESFMQVAKLEEVPAKVRTVLLLDNSRSLALDQLAAIKEAAKKMVDLMFDKQEIAVYSFSGSPNLIADFTGSRPQDKAALKAAIDTIGRSTSNTTNLYGSIVEMLSLPVWKESFSLAGIETGFLVVLTDGEDTSGSASIENVFALRDDLNKLDAVVGKRSIYTIGLGTSINQAVLTSLQDSGYYPVAVASALAESFVDIQSDIIDQANSYYWVNYSSPKRLSKPANQLRKLELKLADNVNTASDGVLTSEFLSDRFGDLPSTIFINRSADRTSGVASLTISKDTSSTASAFTIYPPLDFSQYTWSMGNPLLADLSPQGTVGERLTLLPTGRHGTTTLTATDTISDFSRTITLVIGSGVNPSSQNVNFSPIPDKSPASLPFPLTASSSSGLPVSFSIVSGPASIAGNTVTLSGGTGIVTLRASQSGNESHYAAPDVTRTFNVVADPLAAFLGAAGVPADKQLPQGDPDGDGLSNLLEFAFNLNPASPAGARAMAPGGLAGLPRIGFNPAGVPPGFQIEYLRRKGGSLLYLPEISSDLKNFTPMLGTPAVSPVDSEWERINLTEASPPAGTRRFARVKVSSTVVSGAPAVTIPPTATQLHTGKSATLRVEASGGSLSYQWYRGNVGDTSSPVGSNASSFTTPALAETTRYWARITNASGSTDSPAATVTITQPIIGPTISVQPASATISDATSATLTVSVTGSTPLTYQWYQGPANNTTTPVGTNSDSFTTPALTATTNYWVRVSNQLGTVNSTAAIVSIRPVITTQPVSATVFSGQTATLAVTAAGPAPLTYRWYQGTVGTTTTPVGINSATLTTSALAATTSYWVQVSNAAGNVNSTLATVTVITPPSITTQPASTSINSGSTATLTVAASGTAPLTYAWYQGAVGTTTTPVGTNSATLTTSALTSTTNYWVRVSNSAGNVFSALATVTVIIPPTIMTQPVSATINSGSTATLAVVASGSTPLIYQWYQGAVGTTTTPVGTNSASFTTSALTTETSYWARVSNAAGSVNSTLATVMVAPAITAQPVSTSINSGTTATLTVVASGTAPLTYNWYEGAVGTTTTPVGTNSATLTTSALTSTTNYWVRVSNSAGSMNSSLATVTVIIPPTITTQPVSATINSGSTATLSVVASGTAPLTYQWYQGAVGTTTTPVGTNSAIFTTSVLTTATSYWVRVINAAGNVNSTLATVLVAPAITAKFVTTTINSGSTATLSVVATGTAPLTYQWYQGAVGTTTSPVGTNSANFTTTTLTATTVYWVRVSNSAGSVNSSLAWVDVIIPPSITTQPVSVTINSGGPATLTVVAGGTAPFTYQWYQGAVGTTTLPVGTNSANFTTPTLTATTTYWVRVSNAAGTVISTLATVTVIIPPAITTQPVSRTINSGSTGTLSVVATGTAPLTYQWYQGAVGTTTSREGTNSATLTTSALTSATNYWVRVSNAAGSVNSISVTVDLMALIPAGSFTMGRTSGDTDFDAPPVTVNVSGFYMGKHEVTKALWDEVRTWGAANGYTDLAASAEKAPNHPAQWISWWDVVKWCNARSQMEGLTAVYTVSGAVIKTGTTVPAVNWNANGYRLPTEAEWEKAARGGLSGKRFPWGDTISSDRGNYYVGWGWSYEISGAQGNYHPTYGTGSIPFSSPVGAFAANGYGLYDMVGNVCEWCWDWYGSYANGATDPRGAASGTSRVLRGGGWGSDASYCRAADRSPNDPTSTNNYSIGFRVARSSVDQPVLAPSITTQPASTSIISGQTATLTVTASGTAPLTYQWYQGAVGTTSSPVGTNSTSFTTAALSATTTYWVRVSNSAGNVNSTLATVTVTDVTTPTDIALIPAGSFTMGDSLDGNIDAPPVTVNVSAFFMGKNEETKASWDEVRTWGASNGYTDLAVGEGKATNHPVQSIRWWDVVKWCNARSQKEGLTPVYTVSGAVMRTGTTAPVANWSANGYRLPTEAEWEKAARGGLSGKRFPWGDTISHSQANYYALSSYSYDSSGSDNYHPSYTAGGFPYTSPVGAFAANAYGLHDIAGNVWEWCWDWHGASTYATGATDPRGAASGAARVCRGGGWGYYADRCRAAGRSIGFTPAFQGDSVGFRIARSSVP